MQHTIRGLGLRANAKPKGSLFEIGGEYRYHVWENKAADVASTVSPYLNFQASRYTQKAYNEDGAGVLNRQTRQFGHTYAAAEVGVDFQHQTERGQLGARVGYKQVLAGHQSKLSFNFAGNGAADAYTVHAKRDRQLFTASLQGGYQLTKRLSVAAQLSAEKGKKEQQLGLSAYLQYRW